MGRLGQHLSKKQACEDSGGVYSGTSPSTFTCVGQQIKGNESSSISQFFGASIVVIIGVLIIYGVMKLVKNTRKVLASKSARKLEDKASWRALKVVYLGTAGFLSLLGLGLFNPVIWLGICLFIFYPIFKSINAYVYFGKNTKINDKDEV